MERGPYNKSANRSCTTLTLISLAPSSYPGADPPYSPPSYLSTRKGCAVRSCTRISIAAYPLLLPQVVPPYFPPPSYLSTRKGCAVRSCTLISLAASAAPSSLAAALRIAISSLAWRNFFSTLFLLGPYE